MDVNTPTTDAAWSLTSTGPLGSARVGKTLGAWQALEVRVARGFPECRGLDTGQLEDLDQETALALLSRPYVSETHLRNALRQGIKHRALNLHRDRRRRGAILTEHAPSIQRLAEGRSEDTQPETAALLHEDRQTVLAFLAELNPLERRVFELTAEGLRYRAIAAQLKLPVNLARRTARSVERKRASYLETQLTPENTKQHNPLGVAPIAALAPYVSSLRRWLFGTGAAAKASALVASVAVIAVGAVRAAESGRPIEPVHPTLAAPIGPRAARRATREKSPHPRVVASHHRARSGSRYPLTQAPGCAR